jgi:D-threo-aldose 1-dehydrogenase
VPDAAERVRLGRTELRVTRLGLGTAPLGGLYEPVSEEAARSVVDRAWASGLRFFDTAPLYGHGLAERRLGAALQARPRGEFVLATKVGRLLRRDAPADPDQQIFAGAPPQNPVFDFSEEGALTSLRESLERLGLERADVVHLHDPDDHHDRALVGAYRALDRLRSEGRIAAVGAGMNQAGMLARFAREARFDCFLLAGRFTLLDQSGLDELLPLCAELGVAVIAGGVFNSGILAGPAEGARYNYRPAPPALVERARELGAVCERHGVPLTAAAIQFPLRHPAVAAVVVGARSAAELEEDVRMFEWDVPGALWADLSARHLVRDPASAA